jgi:hypothetical protein
MRSTLAIILGIVVALAVQTCVDLLANQIYPAAITDMWDRQQVSEAFADRPIGALLLSIAGYFLAALVGGWIAKKIAGRSFAAWVPGLIVALMALLIAFSYPIQTWAALGMLVGALLGAMIANHLVATRAAEPPAHGGAPEADA